MSLDRRTLMTAAAGLAAATVLPEAASASAPPIGKQTAGAYRYKVGDIEITAVHDGVNRMKLNEGFVRNAKLPDVQDALKQAFMAPDELPITFTALVVNTGGKLVLIDTGLGGLGGPTSGQLIPNMRAAGIDPAAIDTVVISHFHGDHINGIRPKEGFESFSKAEILVPAPEWDFWMDDAKMAQAPEGLVANFKNVRRVFGPIAKDVKRFDWDREVAPGVTAIGAPGHTPGHTIFAVASGGARMMILSDVTNHPALFVRNPDWSAVFDQDADMARATRHKVLDMMAAERMHVAGYHFPFPAQGYIAKDGKGYTFVPAQWSTVL
ncbi:MBL fold metallo-hydrolase [Alsobacter soli]|uniref:MBL fold metallo-hydrolase n=1 Tax=Alsobacter soli TaxID=2109933 RepID=A0A2T1HMY5_9HYPH|nr:MBL fold metallo-hydrolase [Alsobacter soli]PSC02939.1 MBL fold metallo-hydrolase [Alsobacter soli]